MLTQNEYYNALQELETLIETYSTDLYTRDVIDNRIEELSVAVIEYENFHYPIERPNLITIITFRIDQMGGFIPWLKYSLRKFFLGPFLAC